MPRGDLVTGNGKSACSWILDALMTHRPCPPISMNHWDNRYAERVKLLVEILPRIAKEKRFALKGGTAINLFEHDLPRLSVDIDLTWLPVGDFAQDAKDISAALEGIGEQLRSGPLRLQLQTSGTEGTGIHRLIASRSRSRVQIETTPVMRGTVHPVRTMRVIGVERDFGFAEMQVLDFADLYAGKISAALSRQHPRDYFDMQPLLDGGRLDEGLWRTRGYGGDLTGTHQPKSSGMTLPAWRPTARSCSLIQLASTLPYIPGFVSSSSPGVTGNADDSKLSSGLYSRRTLGEYRWHLLVRWVPRYT